MGATTNTDYDMMQFDGVRQIFVRTAATADSGNTTTVDLKKYGCTTLVGILGFVETTAGSVVVQEQPTTAVASGVVTITLGGSSVDDKVRNFILFAR